MSAAQDSALAFMLTEQSEEVKLQELQRVQDEIALIKGKARAKKTVAERPMHIVSAPSVAPGPIAPPLPVKGTLDAASFMQAIRQAGRRVNDKGVSYTDQNEVRGDTIKAIAGFIGWNPRESFGSQEQNARAMASRMLSKRQDHGMTREELRSASRSLTGYVAGMPDRIARCVDNLKARAVTATEAMIQHEKDSQDMSRGTQARLLSEGLAQVERERIEQIRADIRAMGFEP